MRPVRRIQFGAPMVYGMQLGRQPVCHPQISVRPTKETQMSMNSDTDPQKLAGETAAQAQTERRPLSETARRALAEAEERRRARDAASAKAATEVGGRDGPDPVRYGDWEKDGIASDF